MSELRKHITWSLEWLCEDIDALAERDAGLDLALDTVRDNANFALRCWRELNGSEKCKKTIKAESSRRKKT